MRRRWFTFGAFGSVVSLCDAGDKKPETAKEQTDVQWFGLGNRVVVSRSKKSVVFRAHWDLKLGHNSPVTLDEAKAIAAIPELEGFSICMRIDPKVLAVLLGSHKPVGLILGVGYDDICSVLQSYPSLENLTIMGGGISGYGLERLLKIPGLKQLGIVGAGLDSELIEQLVLKSKTDVQLSVVEMKAVTVWPK